MGVDVDADLLCGVPIPLDVVATWMKENWKVPDEEDEEKYEEDCEELQCLLCDSDKARKWFSKHLVIGRIHAVGTVSPYYDEAQYFFVIDASRRASQSVSHDDIVKFRDALRQLGVKEVDDELEPWWICVPYFC